MFKSGSRILGSALLIVALVAAARDAAHSLGPGGTLTSEREAWAFLHRTSLERPSAFVERQVTGTPFEPLVLGLVDYPVWLVLGVLGLVLYLVGRRRHRRSPEDAAADMDAYRAMAEGGTAANYGRRSELWPALLSSPSAVLGTFGFSLIINMLMLTGAMFMLQIYDRVLPSRSVATLIGFAMIALILFTALGLLDVIRNRLLVRVGRAFDETLAERVFDVVVRIPLRVGKRGSGSQAFLDFDAIRSFLSSPGPTALFDLPWLPVYLGIVWAFHPWLGTTALIGAVVLIGLTLLTELLVRRPTRETTALAGNRRELGESCLANAEVLAGMGFAPRLGRIWRSSNDRTLASQQRASDITGGLGAIARVLRMILQSAVLAVGAYLVILQEASPGIIIAGSILAARALAPVDIAIAHWRGFMAARQSWKRLDQLFAMLPATVTPTPLPAPCARLQVENVVVVPPGDNKVIARDINFTLNAGQVLGIIGPSGSGKSSLARVLVGAWLPAAGTVRLDGAALDQWAPEALGGHIGYLPQGVGLMAGTIAQNIARFDRQADPDAVIEAAKAAEVDELVRGLPGDRGYDTEIGEGGTVLSAGQRQRVALARALCGDPFCVVLDEPDASLDQAGERALVGAIRGVRERGGIAVVISHRQMVLGAVDFLLVMQAGKPPSFGPKDLVLQRLAAGRVHILK